MGNAKTRAAAAAAAVTLVLLTAPPTTAGVPFPSGTGADPYDYTALHIENGACTPLDAGHARPPGSDLPDTFDCRNSQLLTSYAPQPGDADYDPLVANNPQELFGVKGSSTNLAWEITTGRPDTVIAVMDSGIEWNTPELVAKVALNPGELPRPCVAGTCGVYDANGDGFFNVGDYANDDRLFPANGSYLTGQDLVRAFSDGVDDDGDGYADNIAGWDFWQRDNDPSDDVTYGHGTGEAKDSSADVDLHLTQCPNCMFLPLRVGDSFIANMNTFAEAVVYAVDHEVSVIQEALGTLNHTAFGQAAVDYAYDNGVLVVASEADEEAGHHNYPAALNHTMVVNSVTHAADVEGVGVQRPMSFLTFNGCTNWGGYTWVTVESNSCSSAATGSMAGIAGLLYGAARNAIESGTLDQRDDTAGRPLSAEEAKQLVRLAADDVDFSTPQLPFGPPNNFVTTLPASVRYVTTAGWDQITGFGRINANTLVRLVAQGVIPPEADVTSPKWWTTMPTRGSVEIVGRVAAPRADSYTYEVEFAPGVQPPKWPLEDQWTTVATGNGDEPRSGVLATIDLADVRHAIDLAPPVYTPADDPVSRDLPEQDAFRVRVLVHADGITDAEHTAIEQRAYFSHDDPDLLRGFPIDFDADGAMSGAFADLTGDGRNELVIGDGNGFVHAFEPDGDEAPGWPVHTTAMPLPHTGDNAYTDGAIDTPIYASLLLGAPMVADLDGTGWPSVAVADTDGNLHVWDAHGRARAGFPVRSNPAYSHNPGCQLAIGPMCDEFVDHPVRDHINTVDRAFSAPPAAGDIDKNHPGLELVIGSWDGHVYAFHADGSPVPGWPVLLRDPSKVKSVDPVSHRITFKDNAHPLYGRQVIAGVSIGDVAGTGTPQIAVNVDEEYEEEPNASIRDPLLGAAALIVTPGNTRTYLLWADGTDHPVRAGQHVVPNLGNNAYVPGWPVRIAMIQTELLPDVGSGSDGAPTIASVDGTLKIATASIAGPPYLLNADGTSAYGVGPDDQYLTMASGLHEFKNPTATDGPSFASLGGGVFGHLAGPGSPLAWAMGATGLRRAIDVALPDQQLLAEDHLDVWDVATGTFLPGFPAQMNDLQFFVTPAIADIDGSGVASVIQGSSFYDLRAYHLGGLPSPGWPKFTGGWIVGTPAVGSFSHAGTVDVAITTREGNLYVWRTPGDACQPVEWPQYQHDTHNSGNFETDAIPPGAAQQVRYDGTVLRFTSPGGNGYCGRAASYVVTVDGVEVATANRSTPVEGGHEASIRIGAVPENARSITVQAVDTAGNRGIPSVVSLAAGSGGQHAGEPAADQLPPTGGSTRWLPMAGVALVVAAALQHAVRRSRETGTRSTVG